MSYLLGLSGSLRAASTNTKLMRAAARIYDPADFVEGDLDLPLYNGDVEAQGLPDKVQTLSDRIAGAEAVIISCPEYNKALSGVMKNALDWVSRTKGSPWRDKPVAIMSATAGRAGGERSQSSLRLCLNPFRPVVIPGPEVLIAGSGEAFDENDELVNEASVRMLTDLMDQLRAMARG
jgi:chromate reductase